MLQIDFQKTFPNLELEILPIVVIVIRQVLQLSLGIYILVFLIRRKNWHNIHLIFITTDCNREKEKQSEVLF
ncbi:hypothetical protein DN410_13740 [Bacillus sp. SH5-2]|nr:hypothetical protein DN410_13740 [Bacillus sp. SH5-2]